MNTCPEADMHLSSSLMQWMMSRIIMTIMALDNVIKSIRHQITIVFGK